MARLQKRKIAGKKPVGAKKSEAQTSWVEGSAVGVKSGESADLLLGAEKKKEEAQKKRLSYPRSVVKDGDKNFYNKSLQFLKEVRVELRKVTWPSRKQTLASTAVVIVLVMILSVFLGLVDAGLSGLVRVVLN